MSLSRGPWSWLCRPRCPPRRRASTTAARTGRATSVRARLVHAFEPEPRASIVRIDQVFFGRVDTRHVSEHGPPEGDHFGGGRPARNDDQALDRRRIAVETELCRRGGDLACDF